MLLHWTKHTDFAHTGYNKNDNFGNFVKLLSSDVPDKEWLA